MAQKKSQEKMKREIINQLWSVLCTILASFILPLKLNLKGKPNGERENKPINLKGRVEICCSLLLTFISFTFLFCMGGACNVCQCEHMKFQRPRMGGSSPLPLELRLSGLAPGNY